jgi:hypothetical protein
LIPGFLLVDIETLNQVLQVAVALQIRGQEPWPLGGVHDLPWYKPVPSSIKTFLFVTGSQVRFIRAPTLSILPFSITTLSIMTFSVVTFSIMTFSMMTFSIMTLSIMTLSTMTLSIMTFSIMTFSIMTFSIMTFSIMTLSIMQHNGSKQNKKISHLA